MLGGTHAEKYTEVWEEVHAWNCTERLKREQRRSEKKSVTAIVLTIVNGLGQDKSRGRMMTDGCDWVDGLAAKGENAPKKINHRQRCGDGIGSCALVRWAVAASDV